MSEQEPTVNDPTDNNSSNADGINPDATNVDGNNIDANNIDANNVNANNPGGHEDGQRQDAKETSTEPTVEIPAHEAELTKLRAERDLLEQKLQRAMADTQNIRRRQRQEMDDSRRRVVEGMTQELLPVLDSFALALQAYDSASDGPPPKD